MLKEVKGKLANALHENRKKDCLIEVMGNLVDNARDLEEKDLVFEENARSRSLRRGRARKSRS